jgi:type II secretory pathway pseudopilin PulG
VSRGVTLIELLTVLGLLLAMAALALPLVHGIVERRRFEGAVEEVVGMLLLARSHARLEATTVEVVLVGGGSGPVELVARQVELSGLALEESDDPPPPLSASWAKRRLPEEVRVSGEAVPESAAEAPVGPPLDGASTLAAWEDAGDDGQREGGGVQRRLALYAPDGSAPVAGRLTLIDEAGRRAVVRINPWTGYASIVVGSAAPGVGASSEPSPAQDTAEDAAAEFREEGDDA